MSSSVFCSRAAMMLAVFLSAGASISGAQAQQVAKTVKPGKSESCSFTAIDPGTKEEYCVKKGTARPQVSAPASASAAAKAKTTATPGAAAVAKKAGKPASKPASNGLALKPSSSIKGAPAVPAVPPSPAAEAALANAGATSGAVVAAKAIEPTRPAVPPQPVALTATPTIPVAGPATQSPAAPAPAVIPASTTVAVAPAPGAASRSTAAPVPAPRKLGAEGAARRFTDGLDMERRGESQAAMVAYLDAAESGHGLAQKRLGDIYGTGTSFAERDYELALKWYQRARQQGIEIPKPFTFSGVRQ